MRLAPRRLCVLPLLLVPAITNAQTRPPDSERSYKTVSEFMAFDGASVSVRL